MSRTQTFKGHVVQSATIVVGIVVALVLGSVWDHIGDRLDEREYEERLLAEFRNGRLELDADQVARSQILTHVERLLDPESTTPLAPDSAARYVAAVVDFRFFTPSHPVLDDLIAGGKLDLLESDELRAALLGYLQERDRLAVVEERERRLVSESVEPYLVEHLPIELQPSEVWPFAADLERLTELAQDPRFRTILALRWERTELAHRFATGLGIRIDNVVALLER